MQLKRYLYIFFFLAIFSWGSFFVVINTLSPNEYKEIAFLFFFLSFFISVFSTVTLLNFYIRKILLEQEYFRILAVSARQGIFIAALLVFLLILQLLRVLNWWIGFLLILSITMLEYYFSSKENL